MQTKKKKIIFSYFLKQKNIKIIIFKMSIPLSLFKSRKEQDEEYAKLYDEPSSML
jgi:hypothetical protein